MRTMLVVMSLLTAPAASSLAAASADPGATRSPSFALPARDGRTLQLKDFDGQVVLLNFWATWCGPCRQEMPLLQQIHAKYEPLGFTVIAINVENDATEAERWLAGVPVAFPVLFDARNEVSRQFGIKAMPSSVLIDRKGNVRHVHLGYKPGDEARYADLVRTLVKEAP